MAVYRFPYERTSKPYSTTFLKFKNSPILKVGLLADSGQWVKLLAYIDTGAQFCLVNNAYAKHLGIREYKKTKNSEDVVPLGGIGGGIRQRCVLPRLEAGHF